MSENPLLPATYDVVWTVVVIAVAVLTIWALVRLAKSALDAPTKLAWAAFILVVPFLGAIIWLGYRRNQGLEQPR